MDKKMSDSNYTIRHFNIHVKSLTSRNIAFLL